MRNESWKISSTLPNKLNQAKTHISCTISHVPNTEVCDCNIRSFFCRIARSHSVDSTIHHFLSLQNAIIVDDEEFEGVKFNVLIQYHFSLMTRFSFHYYVLRVDKYFLLAVLTVLALNFKERVSHYKIHLLDILIDCQNMIKTFSEEWKIVFWTKTHKT